LKKKTNFHGHSIHGLRAPFSQIHVEDDMFPTLADWPPQSQHFSVRTERLAETDTIFFTV
jgi:hypothetical protein